MAVRREKEIQNAGGNQVEEKIYFVGAFRFWGRRQSGRRENIFRWCFSILGQEARLRDGNGI